MDGMKRLAVSSLLLLLVGVSAHSRGCAPEFLQEPESVVVSNGDSISFSCILTNLPLDEWFINGTDPVSSTLPQDSYISWSGCTGEPNKLCGGTLFIKQVDWSFNGSTVTCEVAHSSCEGWNVSRSRSAVILVKDPSTSESAESSSVLQLPISLSAAPSPVPSPSTSPPPKPSRKPPTPLDKSAQTDKTTMRVTERLVQRVPLMAGAAGVCLVVGCVFGVLCAVTISRGNCRRRHKHRRRRRRREEIQISPPIQSEADPNYAELTPLRITSDSSTASSSSSASSSDHSSSNGESTTLPASSSASGPSSSSGQEERRENEYTELGMPDSPQFPRPAPATARAVSGAVSRASASRYEDSSVPPLPPRGDQCHTCIEVDLDELERAVLEQK